ncbi:MAG: squalene/phytoene synthase family protein [Pseudomonadota bacterium]
MTPEAEHLAALAEEGDGERSYMTRLLLPEFRYRVHALIAFDAELAKVPLTVSEPMLGEIRLAWWREALEDLFERDVARGHEVLQALAATREEAGWRRELLDAMIDARALSLGGVPMNEEACADFVENTGGAFHRLGVAALGDRSDRAGEVAGLVGWAEGAARLADALRAEAAERKDADELLEIAERLTSEGRSKLTAARARYGDVRRSARTMLCSVLFSEAKLAPGPAPAERPDRYTRRERLRLGWRFARRRF